MQKFNNAEARLGLRSFRTLTFGGSLLFAAFLWGCGGQKDDEIAIRNGDSAKPVRPIDHGFLPTNVSVGDAKNAYEIWKEARLEDCGEGVFRVRWDNDRPDATISQGIGYGMLLTVAHGDRNAFNGLWKYYQASMNERGLMHWLRHGCDAHRETKYSDYPDDAASDADLDVAMALILADCKWGGEEYASSARVLLEAIRDNELIVEDGRTLLLAGDNTWFVGMGGGCLNPSYSAPGYYRYFAEFVSDEPDKEMWRALAKDTYALLTSVQAPETGLVPNWSNALGESAECASTFACADEFGGDAARTSYHVATDYLWYGKSDAREFLHRATSWAKDEVGIENLQVNYLLDGEESDCESHGDRTASVGSFANGAVGFDQETVNAFARELKKLSPDDEPEQGLKALYLLQLSGQFTTCDR